MYSIRDDEPSDWMTDAPHPVKKIPQIIGEFKTKLDKLNIPFVVQDKNGISIKSSIHL